MTEPSGIDSGATRYGLRKFARRHGLVSFFVLAYGISWAAWTPFVLSRQGVGLLPFTFPELILGSAAFTGVAPGAYLGPLGAAFLVTALAEGRAGLRRWRARLLRWRFRWYWYAFAVLGVPVVLIVGTLPFPGAATGLRLPSADLLATYLPFLLFQMATTALSEGNAADLALWPREAVSWGKQLWLVAECGQLWPWTMLRSQRSKRRWCSSAVSCNAFADRQTCPNGSWPRRP